MGGLRRAVALVASLGLLTGCGSSSQPGAPGSGMAARPSASHGPPAPPASAAPGSRAAVRENVARGPFTKNVALETRALISKAARTVFDLGVTEPHTYFAGGVLVHNKVAPQVLGGYGRPCGPVFFRHAAKEPEPVPSERVNE